MRVSRLTTPGRYCDGLGLWLQVRNAGNKSWLFRYMRAGKAHHMGLGPLHTVSLAEARERALRARQCLLDGGDPIAAKRDARMASQLDAARQVTFRQCAEDYIAAHSPAWRSDKYRWHWRSSLEKYAYPIIGELPVAEIDTTLVLKVLRPVWQTIPETANSLRSRLEAVLAYWAATQKVQCNNPARWRGHLDTLLPSKTKLRAVKHHAALAAEDLPAFVSGLQRHSAVSARALEFTILTAARTGEVTGATWDEVDLAAKVWTIPAERMKASRAHRVPLSDRAIALLGASSVRGPIFPGARPGKPMSDWTMLRLLQSIHPELTVHGFRSTFSDWARDRTSFPRDIVELSLAHAIRDKTEAAYRRGDALEKRRKLMEAWAQYCSAATSGKVVVLHG